MAATWTHNFDTGTKAKKYLLTKLSSKILNYRVTDTSKTITKSWWYLKDSFDDLDSAALLSKEITTTSGAAGVIVPASGSANASLQFLISDADFDSLPEGDYVSSVKSLFSDGTVASHTNTFSRVRVISPGIEKLA